MQKNVAGQKWVVFAFNRTNNVPKTGDAANITANLRIDGGAANAVDDTNPAELEDGYYVFDITQTESNGDQILISPESTTADIQVIGCPAVYDTVPPSFNSGSLATEAKQDIIDTVVDAIKVVTDAQGATGTGLTAIPWNAAWDVEVESEVNDALIVLNLDHLMKTPVASNADMTVEVPDGTVLSNIMSKTSDTSTFVVADDSLEAISDMAVVAGTDWTAGERENIREALGVAGTKAAGTGGKIQTIEAKTTLLSFTSGNVHSDLKAIEASATVDGKTLTTMFTNMISALEGVVVRTTGTDIYSYKKQNGTTNAFILTVSATGRTVS